MPQMAPMNWIFIFMMFSILFILFNFLNFYLFKFSNKLNLLKMKFNSMNWKW